MPIEATAQLLALQTRVSQNSFTASQLNTLKSIIDTVFSSAPSQDLPPEYSSYEKFLTSSASELQPNVEIILSNQISKYSSEKTVKDLKWVLDMLETRVGCLALTGYNRAGWRDLTTKEREQVIIGWSQSRFPTLRGLYFSLTKAPLFVLYSSVDSIIEPTGYPLHGDPKLVDYEKPEPEKFDFIPFQENSIVESEVVIIGSGAGGGVVADDLTRKGHKVLVLEKSTYTPSNEFKTNQAISFDEMFEGAAMISGDNGGPGLLAGSTFGGGTTINWSGSLRPPHSLRTEWATKHGLPFFQTNAFSDSVDYVCEKMKVANPKEHSKQNQLLIEGCVRSGYGYDLIPQNDGGHPAHWCGFCTFGCEMGIKQSGPVNWLVSARDTGNCQFMTSVNVVSILFSSPTSPTFPSSTDPSELSKYEYYPSGGRTKAVGVLIKDQVSGKLALVKATKKVVVSGGSLNSPAILLRSGIGKWNSEVGKNLKLHPSSLVTAWYPEKVNPWDGPIMTVVSTANSNREGTHYGPKVIAMQANVTFNAAASVSWKGSLDHKLKMLTYNNSSTHVVLTRDRDGGTVTIDSTGRPVYNYVISPWDTQSSIIGILQSADTHLSAGAIRVASPVIGVEDFEVKDKSKRLDLNDPEYLEWKEKNRKGAVEKGKLKFASAHQMGTCRMGGDKKKSVVDPRGRVWGTEGLYVADASVLPEASGVNPMITTMAVAHAISQFISQDIDSANLQAKL